MTVPNNLVSRTTARALEEFSDEFRGALVLGDVTQWASELGLMKTSSALKTTYPLPIHAAGYAELKGDIKYRNLYHRAMSMTTKEWSDGVKAKARIVEAPDFSDWAGQPAAMAFEWSRLPNTVVADLLALSSYDGPLLDLYKDEDTDEASTIRLFSSSHLYNALDSSVGTFDNTLTTTVSEIQDGTFFKAITDHFRSIKGPNGKPLGLSMKQGRFLVPSTRDILFMEALERETNIEVVQETGANVAAVTQRNMFKGIMSYVVGDELTSEDYFYAFASGRPGLYPWVVQTEGAPEEIRHDKDSHLYKTSREVGLAYVGTLNAAMAMPQGIARVQITG